jgi:hypothetical protein
MHWSLIGPIHFCFVLFCFFFKIYRRASPTRLAGLSSLGELSMEMTDINIVSGVCTGSQRSAADSYPYLQGSNHEERTPLVYHVVSFYVVTNERGLRVLKVNGGVEMESKGDVYWSSSGGWRIEMQTLPSG